MQCSCFFKRHLSQLGFQYSFPEDNPNIIIDCLAFFNYNLKSKWKFFRVSMSPNMTKN